MRILRALRFASTLDFEIEKETARAIFLKKELLSFVSRERIYAEWKKLIGGVGARRIIADFREVIENFIPSINAVALDNADFDKASAEIRELYLFATSGKENCAEIFDGAMTELRSDNKHKAFGVSVLSAIDEPVETDIDIKLLLIRCGGDVARGVIALKTLLGTVNDKAKDSLEEILSSGFCYRISDMKIDGNDIKALGYKGRRVGEILNSLLYEIAEGKLGNNREELIKRVAEIG